MKLTYYVGENYQHMSQMTARIVIDYIKKNPKGLYCFAGGDTPVETLKILSEATLRGDVDLSQAYFIELDEWVGIDQNNPGSCLSYLKRNLWHPAGIREEQVHVFNSKAVDLDGECKKADVFIEQHGGLSLSLLGVGVNGHLGFNEPGVSFDNNCHVTTLDKVTQEVGKKYFTAEEVDRSKGITLGIKQLIKSEVLIVQASGVVKSEAVKKVMSGVIDSEWPVTAIWKHGNPVLVVNKDVVEFGGT